MKYKLYLSYELSFNSDYDGLYRWLDNHNAIECGDSFCFVEFESDINLSTDEDSFKLLEALNTDLKQNININYRDRFYVVSEFFFNGSKRMAGTFLIGKRRPNPWDGRGDKKEEETRPSIDND